jgi:hypothetical protein
MSAEALVALEAAVAELATLYTAARAFTPLAARAEHELLPQVGALGARLRRLIRHGELSPAEIDAASREILGVRERWRAALEAVRASAVYQEGLGAFAEDRQDVLARLIPQIFDGLRTTQPQTPLHFPVSPSSGRRRLGSSPFLSVPECAERLRALLRDGLVADATGSEWWERDLPSLTCADARPALDTPFALRLAAAAVRVTVFAVEDDPTYRVFTPRLSAPLSVVIAAEADDEWWNAYEVSYRDFRDSLRAELSAHGVPVEIDP